MWGSYYDIPKAIFYLLKEDYRSRATRGSVLFTRMHLEHVTFFLFGHGCLGTGMLVKIEHCIICRIYSAQDQHVLHDM